jgi:thioesterase domain-containing protein
MGFDHSFYGLQAKASNSDAPSHTTIEELATNYVREIEDFEPQGPYYLVGDCAGAIEAYETARQLWLRGKKIGLLVLLDARGPYLANRYWRIGPYSVKDLDQLRRFLMRSRLGMWCGDFAAALRFHLEQSAELPKRERWRFLITKAVEWTTTRFGTPRDNSLPHQEPDNALTESEERLLHDIDIARRRYRSNWPSNYGGRLAVIVNRQWFGFDQTFGWAGMASGGVEIHAIPGDHISYMLEHVPVVANELRACLEKARNET